MLLSGDAFADNVEGGQDNGPKPLSKKALAKQIFYKFTKPKEGQEEVVCSVCLSAPEEGDDVCKVSCGHVFHKSCIEEWFKKAQICPNCRSNIEEGDNKNKVQALER